MKLLFDFFPILLFFIAYKVYDIYVATAVAIVAAILQVSYGWFTKRKVDPMHWVSLGLIVVFGGLTLYLRDEQFIKWKPTVLNWLLGVGFLVSQFFGDRPLIARMLGSRIQMPLHAWRKLNLSWVLFFFVVGGVNLFVVSQFDTDTWVNFKLFGFTGMTLVFLLAQAPFLARHVQEVPPEE